MNNTVHGGSSVNNCTDPYQAYSAFHHFTFEATSSSGVDASEVQFGFWSDINVTDIADPAQGRIRIILMESVLNMAISANYTYQYYNEKMYNLSGSGIKINHVDFEDVLNDFNNTDTAALTRLRANGPVQSSEPLLKTVG